ncbi:MAG: hypothetical protein JSW68_15370, partial [Burkholderiales bacterium]
MPDLACGKPDPDQRRCNDGQGEQDRKRQRGHGQYAPGWSTGSAPRFAFGAHGQGPLPLAPTPATSRIRRTRSTGRALTRTRADGLVRQFVLPKNYVTGPGWYGGLTRGPAHRFSSPVQVPDTPPKQAAARGSAGASSGAQAGPATEHPGAPGEFNLIWVDMEMTGLDPDRDRIIEVALVVTDPALAVLAESEAFAVRQPDAVLDAMD